MSITSTSNPTIKHIRSLRSRKAREQHGQCFVEGIRLVAEAIATGMQPDILVVAPDLLTSDFAWRLVQEQQHAGVDICETSAAVFRNLSLKEGPQGIGAVLRQRWETLEHINPHTPPPSHLWVALDSVQDPGNLGTILRTCDAVGCAGVVLLGSTTDPYDPAAVRGSMGALFAQRLARATFEQFIAWKQQHHLYLVGTSDAAATTYRNARYTLPLALLMGSEREGLSSVQQALCDVVVRIPMVGRSDSLNLAVATGVLLYEVFAQVQPEA